MLKSLFGHVDVSAVATMYYVMASGELKLDFTFVPCIDASAAATMYYAMASGTLELNVTLVPCIDAGTAATMYYVMASSTLKLNVTLVPCVDAGAPATTEVKLHTGGRSYFIIQCSWKGAKENSRTLGLLH